MTVLETSGHPVAAQSIVLFLRAELAFSATRDSVQSRCVRACRVYRSPSRKFFHSYTPRDIAVYSESRKRDSPLLDNHHDSNLFTLPSLDFPSFFIISQYRKLTCAYTRTMTHTYTHTRHTFYALPISHVSSYIAQPFQSTFFFLISVLSRTRTSQYKQESLMI